MSLTVELFIAHGQVLLVPTIRAVPALSICLDLQPDGAGSAQVFLTVEGENPATVETALANDDTVTDPSLVADGSHRRIYRIWPAEGGLDLARKVCDLGIWVVEATGHDGGWLVRMQVPTREDLVALRSYCRDNGVTYRLERLHRTGVSTDTGTPNLTDSQRLTLEKAYLKGYFDVPRRSILADLGAEFDVSTSAVSQRLRRATATLIEDCLDPEEG